jgi:hypothetical protein
MGDAISINIFGMAKLFSKLLGGEEIQILFYKSLKFPVDFESGKFPRSPFLRCPFNLDQR